MLQDIILSITLTLMGILAAIFIWIAVGASSTSADSGAAVAAAYRRRVWLFWIAVIVLIGANFQTLRQLPYVSDASASVSASAIQPVDVVGVQWSWDIKPEKFHVGQTVEFRVTSKDVNHGFGLYNPEMQMVAQTQAMPGYTNRVRYTFTKPGKYQVMCLEYCGVAHAGMNKPIIVE